jgi:hypothetical protein
MVELWAALQLPLLMLPVSNLVRATKVTVE